MLWPWVITRIYAAGPGIFLCGTAPQSCPVCTIWATGPCDVVASVVFALFVFVLTFLVLTSLFTR